jgi:hypothetical protein
LRHLTLSNAKAVLFSPEPSTERLPTDQGLYGLFQGTCGNLFDFQGHFQQRLRYAVAPSGKLCEPLASQSQLSIL